MSATAVGPDGELTVSPYPSDPWLSVPAEQETPTPPLFRAAVDSVYGPAAEDVPATEADVTEWLETAPPAGLGKEETEDSFLAPLKPLPRPDDTDVPTASRSMFEPLNDTGPQDWPSPPEWPRLPEAIDEQPEPEQEPEEPEPVVSVFTPEPPPAPAVVPTPGRRRAAQTPTPTFSIPVRPAAGARPSADSLDPESLLRGRRNAPSKGWRRLIYKASGGWIKPGEPLEVRLRRELLTRARTPVATGHHRVAVLSLKGGVGKTTTTVGLGATLAQVRGDRVIAVDANPDRGTLSDKLVLETSATVRDLLNEREQVKRYVDIRAFTSQAPSRLEVLASDRDPSVSEAFSGADYQAVSQVLENFYSICITDCGTGLLHSAMGGVLGLADQIVLVSSPSVDGARAASATLDWLEAHHYGDLVKDATVVLCSVRPRSKSAVDIKKLEAHFAARCRAVIRVPYDPHLEEGAEIDLDRLQEPTREAFIQLAACVGDGFAPEGGH
ncbi:AAA family ATPase [Nonomuraea sp. NPDC050556]|uniref:MinD/ParA family ATP-binding protein n=1 Tax=Nonomuraea sp. NPDC050556 TaxID=3364369 RepID=UPI00379E5393